MTNLVDASVYEPMKDSNMHLSAFQGAGLLFRASPRDDASALKRTVVFVEAILELVTNAKRAEDIISARYEGQAWCDSTERQLSNDIQCRNLRGRGSRSDCM
jgi:hypothetical protein